jgi:hypothetical protein
MNIVNNIVIYMTHIYIAAIVNIIVIYMTYIYTYMTYTHTHTHTHTVQFLKIGGRAKNPIKRLKKSPTEIRLKDCVVAQVTETLPSKCEASWVQLSVL